MPENTPPTDALALLPDSSGSATQDSDFQELVPATAPQPSHGGECAGLIAQLGLSQYMDRPDLLKSELQKLVLSLHPDKTGGAFGSERDKAMFMKARRATELLNSGQAQTGAAAGATPLPGSTRAISDGSSSAPAPGSARHLQRHSMAEARERIARRFAAPKMGSVAMTAVLLVLAVLSEQFENNPVFGPLLANPFVVWPLVAIPLAALAGIWLWERSAEAWMAHLMSEAALAEIFQYACRYARRLGRAGRLSASDIRRAIELLVVGDEDGGPTRGSWLSSRLDPVTLESISAVQTQRLLERKVMKVLNTPSIEVLYEVSPLAMPG